MYDSEEGKETLEKVGDGKQLPTTTKKTFRVPNKGYKNVFFTLGTAMDAAKFTERIDQQSRYVATLRWN